MRTGYIYLITNIKDGKIYVGQTARDVETRFQEHLWGKSGQSRLHKAIQNEGWQNFKVEVLETPPLNELDQKEKYWITKLDARNPKIGYNIAPGGSDMARSWNKIYVVENNLVFNSAEDAGRLFSQITSWSNRWITNKIRASINTNEDLLGYHFKYCDFETEDSDLDVLIDWIKTLNIQYTGKHVYCKELNLQFETQAQAAKYLIDNKLCDYNEHYPVQSVLSKISCNINKKNNGIQGFNNIVYNFELAPGTTKQPGVTENPFSKMKVYCPQIDKTFNSQTDAAHYFIDNKIWTGIKFKTAKLRISDVITGAFTDYKGYTFNKVEET